ncbi:MAG: type II secretion system protein [Candidatus Gastranaerophilales bacterium]
MTKIFEQKETKLDSLAIAGYDGAVIPLQRRGGNEVDGVVSMTKRSAFTLAEVLITLGIIGVVSAMTIPNFMTNYEKKIATTRLKKAYSEISQAMLRSEIDNGEMTTWPSNEELDVDTFFTDYWEPYFQYIELCDTATNCGYTNDSEDKAWTHLNGDNFKGWSIVTADSRLLFKYGNGNVIFYPRNTYYLDGSNAYVDYFVVDINGSKTPNIIGKDAFLFTRTDFGIKPYGYDKTQATIDASCDLASTGYYCGAKIMKNSWEISEDYPW